MDISKKYKKREWLYKEYITLKKSIKQIRKENGWGVNTIKRWLHYHNISIRQIGNDIVKQQNSHCKENHPLWKGYDNNNGYIYIYMPEHPNASKNGYVSQSRVIAGMKLGRTLGEKDIVHHVNGRRSDNRQENLHVCNRSQHKNIHADIELLVYQLLEKGLVKFEGGKYGFVG